jgi:hypothetical protein
VYVGIGENDTVYRFPVVVVVEAVAGAAVALVAVATSDVVDVTLDEVVRGAEVDATLVLLTPTAAVVAVVVCAIATP